jgi:hypothetical protein
MNMKLRLLECFLTVVREENISRAAKFAFGIKSTGVQQRTDKPVQPFHAENFILYKFPHG